MLELKNIPKSLESKIRELLEGELEKIDDKISSLDADLKALTDQRREIEKALYSGKSAPVAINIKSSGVDVLLAALNKYQRAVGRTDIKNFLSEIILNPEQLDKVLNRTSVALTGIKKNQRDFRHIILNGSEYFAPNGWFEGEALKSEYMPAIKTIPISNGILFK